MENGKQPDRKRTAVKSRQQMILALELRASGASFEQIGKSLDPPVSRQRAHKIVQKGLTELAQVALETAEQLRQLELLRLNRLRLALEPKKSDPRVADTLLRISERTAKLHGLDAPQRMALEGANGGPIQTQEQGQDFSKLSVEELLELERLHKKMAGAEGLTP